MILFGSERRRATVPDAILYVGGSTTTDAR